MTSLTQSWVSLPAARWDAERGEGPAVGQHHLPDQGVATLAGAEHVLQAALLEGRDGRRREHAAVGHHADPADGEAAAQAVDDGEEDGDVGGVAGPHLRADGVALGVDHHAEDHLHQVGPVVLRIAPLAQALPARAGEAERGGVHEHHREFGEEVAPPREQALLDQVLDRARSKRRGTGLLVGGQFLAEPGHGAVEVV